MIKNFPNFQFSIFFSNMRVEAVQYMSWGEQLVDILTEIYLDKYKEGGLSLRILDNGAKKTIIFYDS